MHLLPVGRQCCGYNSELFHLHFPSLIIILILTTKRREVFLSIFFKSCVYILNFESGASIKISGNKKLRQLIRKCRYFVTRYWFSWTSKITKYIIYENKRWKNRSCQNNLHWSKMGRIFIKETFNKLWWPIF